jgi:hypothetical protein
LEGAVLLVLFLLRLPQQTEQTPFLETSQQLVAVVAEILIRVLLAHQAVLVAAL